VHDAMRRDASSTARRTPSRQSRRSNVRIDMRLGGAFHQGLNEMRLCEQAATLAAPAVDAAVPETIAMAPAAVAAVSRAGGLNFYGVTVSGSLAAPRMPHAFGC
jgi:hypothetical protein